MWNTVLNRSNTTLHDFFLCLTGRRIRNELIAVVNFFHLIIPQSPTQNYYSSCQYSWIPSTPKKSSARPAIRQYYRENTKLQKGWHVYTYIHKYKISLEGSSDIILSPHIQKYIVAWKVINHFWRKFWNPNTEIRKVFNGHKHKTQWQYDWRDKD